MTTNKIMASWKVTFLRNIRPAEATCTEVRFTQASQALALHRFAMCYGVVTFVRCIRREVQP
jgi:hypothetical protein